MKQSRLPDGKRQLKGGIFHGGGSSPLQLCTLMQIYTNSGPTQGQIWQVAGSSREIGFPDVEGHCLHSVSHAFGPETAVLFTPPGAVSLPGNAVPVHGSDHETDLQEALLGNHERSLTTSTSHLRRISSSDNASLSATAN